MCKLPGIWPGTGCWYMLLVYAGERLQYIRQCVASSGSLLSLLVEQPDILVDSSGKAVCVCTWLPVLHCTHTSVHTVSLCCGRDCTTRTSRSSGNRRLIQSAVWVAKDSTKEKEERAETIRGRAKATAKRLLPLYNTRCQHAGRRLLCVCVLSTHNPPTGSASGVLRHQRLLQRLLQYPNFSRLPQRLLQCSQAHSEFYSRHIQKPSPVLSILDGCFF